MEVAKTKQPSKYLCTPQYRRSQLVVKGVKYKQEKTYLGLLFASIINGIRFYSAAVFQSTQTSSLSPWYRRLVEQQVTSVELQCGGDRAYSGVEIRKSNVF